MGFAIEAPEHSPLLTTLADKMAAVRLATRRAVSAPSGLWRRYQNASVSLLTARAGTTCDCGVRKHLSKETE